MINNKAQQVTRGIANKGFIGLQSKATRFNICSNLIGNSPAIPYWPYRHRYRAF